MPKRTNDFQRLIGVIQSHLDPGVRVEEPAFLIDRITEAEREVDIVVRGSVGGHAVVISIECHDRARTDHVGWVEEMHGKHLRLPTNVLILASHSGFSEEAIKVAEVHGIRCFVFDDVDVSSPDRIFPDTQSLWGKTWTIGIDGVSITVDASGSLPRETGPASPDFQLFLEGGTPLCSAAEMVTALVNNDRLQERIAAEIQPQHTFLELGWIGPLLGHRIYLRREDPPPSCMRPIERFNVVARCSVTVHPFPLQYGQYGGVRVAWGKGTMLGRLLMLVVTKDEKGISRLTMKELDPPAAYHG
jgi:hypothetical protein